MDLEGCEAERGPPRARSQAKPSEARSEPQASVDAIGRESRVPETHWARAVVWLGVVASALSFLVAPGAPGRLRAVADTEGCRLEPESAVGAPCACADTPLALREVLGLPAPLNRLDARELERIAGIGPVRAAAIASERARGGAYRSLDELAARVPGVGPGTVDRIRPRLFTAGPDPACFGE